MIISTSVTNSKTFHTGPAEIGPQSIYISIEVSLYFQCTNYVHMYAPHPTSLKSIQHTTYSFCIHSDIDLAFTFYHAVIVHTAIHIGPILSTTGKVYIQLASYVLFY